VLAEIDDVHLLALQPSRAFPLEKAFRQLAYYDPTGLVPRLNPGLRSAEVHQDYELFVLYCQHNKDILYGNAIHNWKRRCKRSVCILDEIWVTEVSKSRRYLERLKDFDEVVVGLAGSVEAVSAVLGRRCHFVPAAVDALRFTPLRHECTRLIDIYSVGRRQEGIHRAAKDLTSREDMLYLFDTAGGADAFVSDYRQHRDQIANLCKRSKLFMVAPALVNMPHITRGQVEVANRYYEGTAAGAVLLGQRPDCTYFNELFDWPDAVIPLRPDGSDLAEIVCDLVANPRKRDRIGDRNAREALLRHDWAYRWEAVLKIMGLSPAPALGQRKHVLHSLAHDLPVPRHSENPFVASPPQ
jgi:hypothetical protein